MIPVYNNKSGRNMTTKRLDLVREYQDTARIKWAEKTVRERVGEERFNDLKEKGLLRNFISLLLKR